MRRLIVATLLFTAGVAHAEIYQCVDANGNKEFAQVCPPGTTPILVKKGGTSGLPTSTSESGGSKSVAEQEADFQKRRKEKTDADKKSAEEAGRAKEDEQNCRAARENLASLQSGTRIATTDPATGERIYIDDEQRAEKVATAQKVIDSTCK